MWTLTSRPPAMTRSAGSRPMQTSDSVRVRLESEGRPWIMRGSFSGAGAARVRERPRGVGAGARSHLVQAPRRLHHERRAGPRRRRPRAGRSSAARRRSARRAGRARRWPRVPSSSARSCCPSAARRIASAQSATSPSAGAHVEPASARVLAASSAARSHSPSSARSWSSTRRMSTALPAPCAPRVGPGGPRSPPARPPRAASRRSTAPSGRAGGPAAPRCRRARGRRARPSRWPLSCSTTVRAASATSAFAQMCSRSSAIELLHAARGVDELGEAAPGQPRDRLRRDGVQRAVGAHPRRLARRLRGDLAGAIEAPRAHEADDRHVEALVRLEAIGERRRRLQVALAQRHRLAVALAEGDPRQGLERDRDQQRRADRLGDLAPRARRRAWRAAGPRRSDRASATSPTRGR